MIFNYSYKDFTIGEIDEYKYYSFVCDGDSKTIAAIIEEKE